MINIKNFLNKLSEFRSTVYVIGDCMVDEYFDIEANRISPEFPIAVMRSAHEEPTVRVPGGAGNAVRQFVNFNVNVEFFGLLDDKGRQCLNDWNISTQHCVDLPDGKHIPVKKRLYNGAFPLCRWDIEESLYGLSHGQLINYQEELLKKYKLSPTPNVIILSDYDKGLFVNKNYAAFTDWFYRDDVISIIDPKKGPIDKWRKCSIFKPNAKEALELSGGLTDWRKQCDYFQARLDCVAIVITNSDKGVMGKVKEKYFEYQTSSSVTAESVIGAGDCFVAFMAMGLATGMDIEHVVEVAYEAGKAYVQRKHNKPLTPYDLLRHADPIEAKMVKPEFLKNRDFKLAMTNGCFDFGLTSAHIKSLQYAKACGDKLVVAINSDASVELLKGSGHPIMSLEERMLVVAGLECVDFVVSFDESTHVEMIKTMHPEFLIKGGDYQAENVIGYGIVPIIIHPIFEGISTTEKLKRNS